MWITVDAYEKCIKAVRQWCTSMGRLNNLKLVAVKFWW